MSHRASLSITVQISTFSTKWCNVKTELYGSTILSDVFGEGKTVNELRI